MASWESVRSTHSIEEEWIQYTTGARCMRLRSKDDPEAADLFVKIDESDGNDWPLQTFTTYRAIAQRGESGDALVPTPVTWSSDPPLICYEWRDGTTVDELVEQLCSSSTGSAELIELSQAVGRDLRRLHTAWTAAVPHDGNLVPAPRRLAVIRRLAGAGGSDVIRRSPGDLGPWNLVMDGGRTTFIDLDDGGTREPEIDLGILRQRIRSLVHRSLLEKDGVPPRTAGRIADAAAGAVLAGYADDSPDQRIDVRLVLASSSAEALTAGILRLRRLDGMIDCRRCVQAFAWTVRDVVGARRRRGATSSVRTRRVTG